MKSPYLIDEPACISFSGGRTSAYMLWRILDANNGLPANTVVCFANTGKEMEQTLEFVRDCEKNFNVPITWIEFRDDEEKYAVVNFATASRNGEPFEAIVKKRNYLPNPVTRFCTIELKIRAMARHLVSVGLAEKMSHAEHMSILGIRADEPRRAAKIEDKSRIPLFLDGVTAQKVGEFWESMPFNLNLPNINGKTLHGNCDLCFLKGKDQIMSLIKESPDRANWWAKMEATSLASKPLGARFRKDRPGYADMLKLNENQWSLLGEDDAIGCFCGD